MTKIQVRRDTAANWTSNDPVLAVGEYECETDTGYTKCGDGTTAWTSLPYDNLLANLQDVVVGTPSDGKVLLTHGTGENPSWGDIDDGDST